MNESERSDCELVRQGWEQGSCLTKSKGKRVPACRATVRTTVRKTDGKSELVERLITSIHLSRPENYLSIYQSGCNLSCRKCHSWHFTQTADGTWYSPLGILKECQEYEKQVTLEEPREKATAWHAHDSCACCGYCVLAGKRSERCPGVLRPDQILLSPQGWGPARNIVAFTGGDLTCRPQFYAQCAELIKAHTRLWILIETNGYGLTPDNLRLLRSAGVDSFWLDIKAYDDEVHRWLTGGSNREILRLPERMLDLGFVIEVLSLYIPRAVETDQIEAIAHMLVRINPAIPFTILAFFPEYRMIGWRHPSASEMVEAYRAARNAGLTNVRLGNVGVVVEKEEDYELIRSELHPTSQPTRDDPELLFD